MFGLKKEDFYKFIEKDIKSYIFDHISKTHVLNEIDLQFKIIYFLELKIDKSNDANWTIFNCYYLKKPKMYPDILIFHSFKPNMCIELKFFGFYPPKKKLVYNDLIKLQKYFDDYPSLLRGYSINVFNLIIKNFSRFDRRTRNKIKDDRINIINLNLREINKYEKIKENYESNIDLFNSYFAEWEK